jgi:RNA polymerase primary sigma factor
LTKKNNNINPVDHLKFVHKMAKHYNSSGIPHEDLYSEGVLGLLEAAKRYNNDRGFSFTTYAVWWIKQKIIAYIAANSRVVYLSNCMNNLNSKAKKEIEMLEQKMQREINDSDLETKGYFFPTKISFDMNLQNTQNETILDCFNLEDYNCGYFPSKNDVDIDLYNSVIDIAKNKLHGRQKDIFISYFIDGNTLEYCGRLNNITREAARQTLKNAIKKVRKYLKFDGLYAKEAK